MNGLSPLDCLRIVLSHPSHPGNIGATARAMKTMGLRRLTLVAPRSFPHDEAVARASGADDLLEGAVVCETLDEALRDAVLVAGVTARRRDLAAPFRWARDGATELVAATAGGTREVALLFGNETAGLSNDELARCHLALTIPANPDYSSLNLAAAVQILCYELRLATTAAAPGAPPQGEFAPATGAEIEGFFAHFERIALANGFLDPANPGRLMPRLRRLFGRARLEHDEVSILRGFLTTVERPKVRKKDEAS